jgi:putative transposase
LPDIDYPFHDKGIVVTHCGRICLGRKKINFSTVFAGQAVGIKEVHDDIWLVSFMDYDLDTSIWRLACWNRSKIRSVQK